MMNAFSNQRLTRLVAGACLLVLAAGCAQGPSRKPIPDEGKTTATGEPAPLSTAEKRRYKQATERLEKQQFSDAIDVLEDLIEQRPRLAGPRVNLALAYHQLDKPEPARAAAQAALELNDKSAEAHFILALIHVKANRYADAEQHYQRALELDPESANAHYNLALLYDIYYQQPADALPHYKKYLELIDGQDEQTAAWVNHLEYSLNRR